MSRADRSFPWMRRLALLPLPLAAWVVLTSEGRLPIVTPEAGAAGPQPALDATRARAADEFADAVGVNIHLAYGPTPYGTDFERVLATLKELGVRHVRDNVVNVPQLYAPDGLVVQRWRRLAAAGIRVTMIADIARPAADMVALAQREAVAIEALEGPNEHNVAGGRHWAGTLRAYQADLYRTAKARGLEVPIIAPSVSWPDFAPALAGLEAFVDFGNIHSYPGGRPPAHDFARFVAGAKLVSGEKPIIATETGYHLAEQTRSDHLPASPRTAAKYLPRLLARYFEAGIRRTFIYQLVDDVADAGLTNPEGHFGLVDQSFTPKPAFRAVANVVGLLRDPGPAFAPGQLRYRVQAPGDPPASLLLQKRDGRFYLLLWTDASAYDVGRRREIENAPLAGAVAFGAPMQSVRLYRPAVSPRPEAEWRDVARVSVPVGDEISILEITSAGE